MNIILNTSCELPSVLLCLLCLLSTPTFVGPPSLCLLVLRNTRTQVSQGRSTYAEAKVLNTSASPPPVVNNPSHLTPLVSEFVGGNGSDRRQKPSSDSRIKPRKRLPSPKSTRSTKTNSSLCRMPKSPLNLSPFLPNTLSSKWRTGTT